MIVSIEGNIGSGKTTILQRLKMDGFITFNEDVNAWSNEGWLSDFYNNINRFAFGFQMRVLQSFSQIKQNIKVANISIIERSPLTSVDIFGYLLALDNAISVNEYKIMSYFSSYINLIPKHIIYIQCDPTICLDRIRKRNRNEENTISIDYLNKLHTLHELTYNNRYNCSVIDGNKDIEEVYKEVVHAINKHK